jgi:STE24 endopeptidase
MEQAILTVFLVLFAIQFAVEFGLNELNLRHVAASVARNAIPELFRGKIDSQNYQRSIEYTLTKGLFQRWSEVYGSAILLIVLFSGLLGHVGRWSAELGSSLSLPSYGQGIIFCVAVGLLFTLTALPTELYSTFVIEAKFGFNKITLGLYLSDKLKGLILSTLLGIPFLFVVLWLMDIMGWSWWLWAFAFISAFQLLLIVIFPTFIAPWFNKFEPLREGELRERILALAEQIGFKTSGIYSMDGSKRSAHSNAYFTGIGKAKRIVLFDTLIDQMTTAQGLAVLAHEMGHYKMKHIRRMLMVQTVFLFGGLYILSLLVAFPPFFSAFGLAPSNHGALVLFTLVSGPFTFWLAPLMNRLSRKHEYEADRFAAITLHDGKPMEEALVNLTVKNLSNLTPHPWYSAYHYSHPTAVERIIAIRRVVETSEWQVNSSEKMTAL